MSKVGFVLLISSLASLTGWAGDWNSLGRVPASRNVKVYLKSGQKLEGTIQQVGEEGLQLVPQDGRVRLAAGDLAKPVEKTQLGQVVEVRTRSGQVLKGKLRKADERSIELVDTGVIQIGRTEIWRVTRRSHAMGALIGLAVAGGAGAIYGARTPGHSATFSQGAAGGAAEGGGLFGLAGGLVGAFIGMEMTIYKGAAN